MPIYLTEHLISNEVGRVCLMDGGNIEADSLEEAEEIGKQRGVTVLGELLEEIEAPELDAFCDQVQKERDEEWKRKED